VEANKKLETEIQSLKKRNEEEVLKQKKELREERILSEKRCKTVLVVLETATISRTVASFLKLTDVTRFGSCSKTLNKQLLKSTGSAALLEVMKRKSPGAVVTKFMDT